MAEIELPNLDEPEEIKAKTFTKRICRGLAANIHCHGIDLDPVNISSDILFRYCFRVIRHAPDAKRVFLDYYIAVFSLITLRHVLDK